MINDSVDHERILEGSTESLVEDGPKGGVEG